MFSFLKEKTAKVFKYIRLFIMFSGNSEFRRIHPEAMRLWRKKFGQLIRYSSNRVWPITKEFLQSKLEKIKSGNVVTDQYTPTLLCVLRNDIHKMKYFMEHYRNLGIKQFVFLDNLSTDGTYEFLLEQEDTTVYRCTDPYTSNRRIAWINRLIAEEGINKWYLLVDSDEFFCYLGCKEHKIDDFIETVSKKGYKRIGVFHLDMYPKGNLFNNELEKNFLDEYIYFDKDTYTFSKAHNGIRIVGGPRKRVFGTNMKISGVRLFFFEEDDVIPSSHFMIPYFKGTGLPVYLISRHYKFVNEYDYEKMLEAVETEKYFNKSEEYKTYYEVLSKNPNISLYDIDHSLLFSEENLRVFPFLETPF